MSSVGSRDLVNNMGLGVWRETNLKVRCAGFQDVLDQRVLNLHMTRSRQVLICGNKPSSMT